jgi:hypothetical protein
MTSEINRDNWWLQVEPPLAVALQHIWIPVGLPGHTGSKKSEWQSFLDRRFGAAYWRIAHYVRGRIVSKQEAIREYEQSYRVHLHTHPDIVNFLATFCGNLYDDNPTNVYDDSYEQPHTHLNHYQDISVRRVMAELAADPTWPIVSATPPGEADLIDLNTGQTVRVPRASGFGGPYLLQIREPETPGFFLNPAVVPVHDPALLTTLPGVKEWYHQEGCAHLSVEAFWQMSKVIEVRYDKFLALRQDRPNPLEGLPVLTLP